jgi:hypothetical protein
MKQLKDMDFEELVTFLSGYALERFVKGDGPWRSIMWNVVEMAVRWHKEHKS